jgi:SSS family solute:Na+ symporter
VLAGLVLLYLAVSLAVGLYAATRVRGAADFAAAGGRFGTAVVTATVFATWFGAETVLGIPATFMKEGLRGIVADPFAAVVCLVLVAAFFARPLHRLGHLTLGDLLRARFDRRTEVVVSLCIAFSYLGWIAAQLVALGLAMSLLSGDAIDMRTGIVVGAAVVLAYTVAGGMWSIALTDLFQAIAIVAGLACLAWAVSDAAGGVARVFEFAGASDRWTFLPEPSAKDVLAWVSAALVVALGSIPQQDVLQRVLSARDESTAARGALLGGLAYFAIAALPIYLVVGASLIDAPMVERLLAADPQRILPTLALERMPLGVQVLFFGALLSAILSTAGGALLAPAVVIAESVLRPWVKPADDRGFLRLMRLTVVGLAIAVTAMALASNLSIYQLVNESGKVVLVSSFVPLAAALFWKPASARGALASALAGLVTWLLMEWLAAEGVVPPPLAGLAASFIALLVGSRRADVASPHRPS